jgi:N-acetylglucosamine malate deacetylase 2
VNAGGARRPEARAALCRKEASRLEPISLPALAPVLEGYAGRTLYLHLETTAGAYTEGGFGAFLRGVPLVVGRVRVHGTGPYRAGIESGAGFVYAEGLTHWAADADGRLLLEGHDEEGRLTVALILSPSPLAVAGELRIVPPVRERTFDSRVPAPTEERAVLLVFGHPDDETFGSGGTIAMYAQAGVPLTCVTLTLGEMGRNMGRPAITTRQTLRQTRERELRAALDVLGVGDLWMVGIWDKTSEFRDVQAMADIVGQALDQTGATRILTSHPVYGGHPDHCSAGRAALLAVRRLPAERRPTVQCGVGPWRERLGIQPESLDISPVADVKLEAIRAHRSQSEGMLRRLEQQPMSDEMRRRFSREYFMVDPALPEDLA